MRLKFESCAMSLNRAACRLFPLMSELRSRMPVLPKLHRL